MKVLFPEAEFAVVNHASFSAEKRKRAYFTSAEFDLTALARLTGTCTVAEFFDIDHSPFCLLETCTCQGTRAKRSERETEEARTGPNEKEEGHLSAKGDVCFFHRNRTGYGLTTGIMAR